MEVVMGSVEPLERFQSVEPSGRITGSDHQWDCTMQSESDDEQQAFGVRKRNRARKLVLRDDSDEDSSPDATSVSQGTADGIRQDSDSDATPVLALKSTQKRKSRILTMPSSDSESEQEKKKSQTRPKKAKKSAAKPTATTKSSKKKLSTQKGDGDSQPLPETESDHPVCDEGNVTMTNEGSQGSKQHEGDDAAAAEFDDEQSPEQVNCMISKSFMSNNDLFDAEDSDGVFSGSDTVHDDDSGYSLEAIKKSVIQKVKQKSAKPVKPKKLSKDGLRQLHSESQRLVRESRVSLPYHVPKPKSLDDFLNRRKSTPTCLRPNSREIASILHAESQLKKAASNAAKESIPSQPTVAHPPENIAVATPMDQCAQIPDPLSAASDGNHAPSDLPVKDVSMPENPTGTQTQDGDFTEDLPELDFSPCEKQEPDLVDDRPATATISEAVEKDYPTTNKAVKLTEEKSGLDVSKSVEVATECRTPLQDERRLLSKLRISLTPHAGETPKLGGKPHSVISLEKEKRQEGSPQGTPISRGGVNGLIHRFMHHSATRRPQQSKQTVELSVLKLKQTSSGEEQLLSEKVKVTLGRSADEIPEGLAPGERMRLFKESLKLKLLRQRTEARQQRALLKAEDEEEELADAEPEEEILGDPTDSEESSSEEEEEADNEALLTKEKKRKRNAFIDDEAEESDDDDMDADDEGADEEDDITDRKTPIAITTDTETPQSLRLCLHLDEEGETPPLENSEPVGNDTVNLSRADTVELFPSLDTSSSGCRPAALLSDTTGDGVSDRSFEMLGSIVPAYQPQIRRGSPAVAADVADHAGLPFTQLSVLSGVVGSPLAPSKDTHLFRSSQFREPESQSADTTLPRQLELDESQTQLQSIPDDLFDLCSGKWTGQATQTPGGTSVLGDLAGSLSTQANMDQLFDLCSGTFSGASNAPSTLPIRPGSSLSNANSESSVEMKKKLKTTNSAFNTGPRRCIVSDDDDDSNSSTILTSVPRRYSLKSKRLASDTEEDDATNDELSDEEANDDFDEDERPKKRINVRDFIEGEAELSGSDVPSDEDEELAEEDDILEEELGDQDLTLSDGELKEQVGKVHHKLLMDEDQKQLRYYKEVYLQDGDLHSETKGRARKYRWNTNDDDSQDNYLRINSDSEMEDNDAGDEEHVAMRLKRHEREKWLSEPKKHRNSDDEDDNLPSLGHKIQVLSRNNSHILMERSRTLDKPVSTTPKHVAPRGSFLSRSKVVLAKIADMTKSTSDAGKKSGPRNARNCVFSIVSPSKEPRPSSPVPPASSGSKSAVRVAKKPRLDQRSTSLPGNYNSNNKSIFDSL